MQSVWRVVAYVFWVGAATIGGYLLMTAHPGQGGALFLARPQAQLWVLALAAQAGLWAAVAPFLWRTCREFSPATKWGWVGWLLLSAVVVVLFVRLERAGLYGPAPKYPLAHHGGRILTLTIAGVALVLGPGILALCLIWQRLRTTAPADGWSWPAAGKQAGELLFGAGTTVVLAAGYFPAYFALQGASRRLTDAIYPLQQTDRPDQSWYADRESFIALLKLETGPVESFRTGVVILAPLLGSLLATLLPIK